MLGFAFYTTAVVDARRAMAEEERDVLSRVRRRSLLKPVISGANRLQLALCALTSTSPVTRVSGRRRRRPCRQPPGAAAAGSDVGGKAFEAALGDMVAVRLENLALSRYVAVTLSDWLGTRIRTLELTRSEYAVLPLRAYPPKPCALEGVGGFAKGSAQRRLR